MTITSIRDRSLTIGDVLDITNMGIAPALAKDMQGWLDIPIDALKGFAQGYNERGDVITETIDGFSLNAMWDEFQRTIRMWNTQRDALTNTLTYNITEMIEGVRYPIEQDFEEATEYGEPKGIRLGPSFRMGFDFKWWDIAIRYTWMFLAEATSAQIQALHNTALEADNRLMFTRVLKRIFNNTTTLAHVPPYADVNAYPFYNGDAMEPPKWKNHTFTTHDHYMASGAGSLVSSDLLDLQNTITEHGYSQIYGYRLVLMVNPQEGAIIRGFKVATGAMFDFIPSANVGGGLFLPANSGIVGAPSQFTLPGLITIGSYGQFVIVEEDYVPAGYMFAYATGGEQNIKNPVGIREHENTAFGGLRLVKGTDNDYPLIDSFYLHGFGTGVRHRGAGAVMKITASSYTVPTDYA